jgi:hypothetical protein
VETPLPPSGTSPLKGFCKIGFRGYRAIFVAGPKEEKRKTKKK